MCIAQLAGIPPLSVRTRACVCVCVCVGVKREARAMTTQPGIGHCSGAFVVGLPRKRDEGDA